MPGWPKTLGRHPNFVPARGAVLADLNNDGTKEIVQVSTDGRINAWKLDGSSMPGFPVTTIGTPQYPPAVGDMDGDGQVEIVQTTRGFTSGGRLYVLNSQGQVLSGWPKSLNNNNVEYSPALADLDNDGKLEIVVGERLANAGRLHVFEKDGTAWGGNWPVTIDHVPTMSAAVADVDGDGNKEVFYPSYNSMYLFRRDGTVMPGWPKQIPGSNFSYQSAAFADLDGNGSLEIVVGTHQTTAGMYAFRHDGTPVPGWPRLFQTWSYCSPTVTDLDGNGVLDVIGGQAGYFSPPSNMFWVWDQAGQTRPGFPAVSDHGGGSEGPLTVADVDGDGIQEIFADHNMMVGGQGFLYGLRADGSTLPGFPLRTTGFTYLNSGTIGDVDNDGDYELCVVASDAVTTVYLYTLPWQYKRSGFEWTTYHSRTLRGGLFSPPAYVTTYRATRGLLLSGNVESLKRQDANALVVRNGIVVNPSDSPVTVEFESVSPRLLPHSIEAEFALQVSNGGLKVVMDLFDFDANAWDTVDAKTVTGPLSTASFSVFGTNLGRYVNDADKKVKARVRVKWNSLALSSTYQVSIDKMNWHVGP